jgi:catechol 2,3-dioxygenase-like lactoylglutathione lyase family enzyme
MTLPGLPAMFHTGYVVDDLETAMDRYTSALGLTWAEPIPSSGLLRTRAGLLPRLQWFTYSKEGPHHLELIEIIDGTAWEQTTRPRLDHVGYWVDDVAIEKARMEALGFACEISGERDDGTPTMSYHLDPADGLYIELVERSQEAALSQWWEGGTLTGVMLERLRSLGLDASSVKAAFEGRRQSNAPAHAHPHTHGNTGGNLDGE